MPWQPDIMISFAFFLVIRQHYFKKDNMSFFLMISPAFFLMISPAFFLMISPTIFFRIRMCLLPHDEHVVYFMKVSSS